MVKIHKQKQLYRNREKSNSLSSKIIKFNLIEDGECLKSLSDSLIKYIELLDLVYIGKINSLWLYKILDKDEFNSKLNINLFLMQTLSSWKDDKFGDKSKMYLDCIKQLCDLIHKEDLNN